MTLKDIFRTHGSAKAWEVYVASVVMENLTMLLPYSACGSMDIKYEKNDAGNATGVSLTIDLEFEDLMVLAEHEF